MDRPHVNNALVILKSVANVIVTFCPPPPSYCIPQPGPLCILTCGCYVPHVQEIRYIVIHKISHRSESPSLQTGTELLFLVLSDMVKEINTATTCKLFRHLITFFSFPGTAIMHGTLQHIMDNPDVKSYSTGLSSTYARVTMFHFTGSTPPLKGQYQKRAFT